MDSEWMQSLLWKNLYIKGWKEIRWWPERCTGLCVFCACSQECCKEKVENTGIWDSSTKEKKSGLDKDHRWGQ